jgi:hypothetical protein
LKNTQTVLSRFSLDRAHLGLDASTPPSGIERIIRFPRSSAMEGSGRRGTVTITPRDRYGSPLGPGRGDQIPVSGAPGTTTGTVVDNAMAATASRRRGTLR